MVAVVFSKEDVLTLKFEYGAYAVLAAYFASSIIQISSDSKLVRELYFEIIVIISSIFLKISKNLQRSVYSQQYSKTKLKIFIFA
jgi:hypothetical protein